MNRISKFINFKNIFILFVIIGSFFITYFLYNEISVIPAKNAFNKAFNFYLVGDCEKYSESYSVSFSDKFLRNYGDTDWVSDATWQKLYSISNKCKSNNKNILDVKIDKISREKFSDTTFIQTKVTTVNNSGVHHVVPQDFVMKKIAGKWMIDIFCDTENDTDCK